MTLRDQLQQLFAHLPGLTSDPAGSYSYSLYACSDDALTAAQLAAIATAPGSKRDAFYEQLDDIFLIWADEAFNALMEDLHRAWCETSAADNDALPWADVYDVARDLIQETVTFTMDYDHFLQQRVYVNIIVNTGDSHTDYTANDLIPVSDRDPVQIPPESSLLWLTRQQGYTRRDLYRTIMHQTASPSVFLQSVYEECRNVTTVMNALTFFVTMTLGDYLDWIDRRADITVSADTACGLWDPWAGGGSTLDIVLEKPVTIPFRYAEPAFDGVRGSYSVADTYGMLRRFWTDTVLTTSLASA